MENTKQTHPVVPVLGTYAEERKVKSQAEVLPPVHAHSSPEAAGAAGVGGGWVVVPAGAWGSQT